MAQWSHSGYVAQSSFLRHREFGFRKWHQTDQPDRSDDVRLSGKTGSLVSGPSGPLLTLKQTLHLHPTVVQAKFPFTNPTTKRP
jgi:hypothetical protein